MSTIGEFLNAILRLCTSIAGLCNAHSVRLDALDKKLDAHDAKLQRLIDTVGPVSLPPDTNQAVTATIAAGTPSDKEF